MRKRSKPTTGADVGTSSNPAASLTRGLDILRAFTPDDATLGNQELIERTGLAGATVSRLTSTLVDLGYLHYDTALGRYSIGAATVSLGYSALSSNPIIHMARPLMQELADQTGAAVALGTRDGLEMVYLANCRSMSPVTLQLNVGSRVPIARTAMGLAYLSGLDAEKRSAVVESLKQAEAVDGEEFATNLARGMADRAELGFVTAFGSWHSYINAVGASFHPTDGSQTVALTCGGIADILPAEHCRKTVGPRLVALVDQLRKRLAGETGSPDAGGSDS
ncbi:IclR family transcriptional regulator [uncultured Hoeflea sp.]|uniref:IclR family transcriptional regulator n=1 Tax=uncultured Hoeflea sp. TaxID=538666 RepID=UPI0030DD36D9|tara:strand:- start:573 stop:1409 length:837 start_codon:yes stop_codon:yes gene_type:complete